MKASGKDYYWDYKPSDASVFSDQVLSLPLKNKVKFILDAVDHVQNYHRDNNSGSYDDKKWIRCRIADTFMRHLLKTKLELDEGDAENIATTFLSHDVYAHGNLFHWPVNMLLNQVEKLIKARGMSEQLTGTITKLKQAIENSKHHDEKEKTKALSKLEGFLFAASNTTNAVRPTWFPGLDDFGDYGNETIKKLKEEEQVQWFRLMQLVQRASGGSPSKKFLEEGKILFKELGADKFKLVVNDWFRFISTLKERTTEHEYEYAGVTHNYSTSEFLAAPNMDMIKGFAWLCVHFHDTSTLHNLANLAEKAYRKIPGRGPAAASIGNACLYTLANVRGLDGVGHLSRLKLRIKQSNTQNLIEKYLNTAAKAQGVSIHEIEDMAVDDYDLQAGEKSFDFDGYKAVLKIVGTGKTDLAWYKPDNTPQKSVPAFIKEKYSAKFKKIKDRAKQVEITTTAQRDRVDRMFKAERKWTWSQFNEYYFSHGLMSFLAHKLVWTFEHGDKKESAIFTDGLWQHPKGVMSFLPGDDTMVSLWHPVYYSVEEIREWRSFLQEKQLVQPLKQVFREVYLLTDAEVNTHSYSNRMAAHILKQHQFNSLAKTRGWKYSLLGAYDDGREDQIASVNLPDYNLRAEFWIHEVNADDAFNDTGIWLYVATDQVRFTKIDSNNVVELLDVPALVFSEVMRDVDLFVGVASVGNDPQWRDSGGLPAYRDYWQAYSFGDLSEIAKTRKTILEKLLPRLKIAKVSEIRDKFLVVKGKLRTYKIHIGSTNILMEPNDQYLCIVPDRSAKEVTQNLFLPFEGDNGVSVILSKAFLLVDDDKITDTTITTQIKRA